MLLNALKRLHAALTTTQTTGDEKPLGQFEWSSISTDDYPDDHLIIDDEQGLSVGCCGYDLAHAEADDSSRMINEEWWENEGCEQLSEQIGFKTSEEVAELTGYNHATVRGHAHGQRPGLGALNTYEEALDFVFEDVHYDVVFRGVSVED